MITFRVRLSARPEISSLSLSLSLLGARVELPPKDRTCSGLRLRADELADAILWPTQASKASSTRPISQDGTTDTRTASLWRYPQGRQASRFTAWATSASISAAC
ncbi:hypothetical protein CN070_22190 [Sinorhizobium meliloti]|nr:hypothetical protein CN070_22190 [Sinorhizobium meliloti]